MANANAHALLAQLMQITVQVADKPKPEQSAQTLAAGLSKLFNTERVLVLRHRRAGKLQLWATDSYQGRPPASAYTDELQALASSLTERFKQQANHLGHNAWLPLSSQYSVLLQRPSAGAWQAPELELLKQVAPAFAAGLRPSGVASNRRWLVVAVLLALLIPVPDQVVAPAIVESAETDVMFAPLEGVIESVVAQPGSYVKKGDVLLKYQQRDWLQQQRQALRDKELAESELERLRAASWQDSQARAAIPAQELRIAQAEQQLDYLTELLTKTELLAEQDGLLQLDQAEALEGALVRAGQKLLAVANPAQPQLKLDVPVSDFGKVIKAGAVSFRSDANPWWAHKGLVLRLGADVYVSEQQRPSLPAWSSVESEELTLGERGTARISTGWTVLAVVLFKKPWQFIRNVLPA